MDTKILLVALAIGVLAACSEDHGETSFELQSELKNTKVTCEELSMPKMGEQFWVRPELDGAGILLVSKSNKKDEYLLSLVSHFHERAFETREIKCEKL